MPINKQFLKSRPEVKVTFAVEKEAAGDADGPCDPPAACAAGRAPEWAPPAVRRSQARGCARPAPEG